MDTVSTFNNKSIEEEIKMNEFIRKTIEAEQAYNLAREKSAHAARVSMAVDINKNIKKDERELLNFISENHEAELAQLGRG